MAALEIFLMLYFREGLILKAPALFLIRPNLFAICNNTFSKWWEVLRMACRRVLSSTPLLVLGSETL
jgi:hypothetical protein